MSTQTSALPRRRLAPFVSASTRTGVARAIVLVAALAAATALRWAQAHQGLLYPDAYQYLLMARGVLEEGRPVLPLGDGTNTLLPNADASLKPLYPALIASVHLLGASWLTAARLVTAVAAGAVVVLTGLLGLRAGGR